MIFLKKVLKFVHHYLFRNPFFLYKYIINSFKKDFSFDVCFYSSAELSQEIANGKSLIRIGDGEIALMNRGGIWYQKYEKEIRSALFASVQKYTNEAPYVLCVNEHIMNKSNTYLRKHGQFWMWLPMKTCFQLYFKKDCYYGDATIFYYKNQFENFFFPYLQNKELILVTIARNIELIKNNKEIPPASFSYVSVKDIDAYDEKGRVYKEIDSLVKSKGKENAVLLFSCGPAAKAFAWEYMQKGVQSIDIGLGIELIFSDRHHKYSLLPKDKA